MRQPVAIVGRARGAGSQQHVQLRIGQQLQFGATLVAIAVVGVGWTSLAVKKQLLPVLLNRPRHGFAHVRRALCDFDPRVS